jgi:hypothetical protein
MSVSPKSSALCLVLKGVSALPVILGIRQEHDSAYGNCTVIRAAIVGRHFPSLLWHLPLHLIRRSLFRFESSFYTLGRTIQGVSKRALQWYSKCYYVASVLKVFNACTPLILLALFISNQNYLDSIS